MLRAMYTESLAVKMGENEVIVRCLPSIDAGLQVKLDCRKVYCPQRVTGQDIGTCILISRRRKSAYELP